MRSVCCTEKSIKRESVRIAAVLTALCILAAAPRPSAGFGRESPNIAIGPSVAFVEGSSGIRGWSYGVDASWIEESRFLGTTYWLTGGVRGIDEKQDSFTLPYAEAGVWLGIINAGIGYSRAFGINSNDRNFLHAFVGIPIPLSGISEPRKPGFFIEPYYRPTVGMDGSKTRFHEYGLLIKFTTLKFGSWSRAYD